jgi:hypothetical protein
MDLLLANGVIEDDTNGVVSALRGTSVCKEPFFKRAHVVAVKD